MRLRLTKNIGGGDEPTNSPSHADMESWNKFVDFAQSRKDIKDPQMLLAMYSAANKGFNPNIKSIQTELARMQALSKNMRRKDMDAISSETFQPITVSGKIDTNSIQRFPTIEVNGRNYGVINSRFQPATQVRPSNIIETKLRSIPQNAEIQTTKEGLGYFDESSGNFIPVSNESFALYKALKNKNK